MLRTYKDWHGNYLDNSSKSTKSTKVNLTHNLTTCNMAPIIQRVTRHLTWQRLISHLTWRRLTWHVTWQRLTWHLITHKVLWRSQEFGNKEMTTQRDILSRKTAISTINAFETISLTFLDCKHIHRRCS